MPSPLQITWLFILISTATIMVGGIWVAGTGTLARVLRALAFPPILDKFRSKSINIEKTAGHHMTSSPSAQVRRRSAERSREED